ncbi:MAG: hypothetical protein HOW73_10070 [Polyangiaceae bacterium]|nr:hypothetical protein [Polyangiaceae bacterium]
MTGAYRDRASGLLLRLKSIRDEIRRLETRISPEIFHFLDQPTWTALFEARARATKAIDADEADSQTAGEAELEHWAVAMEAYASLLDDLDDDVSDIEARARRPGDAPPPLASKKKRPVQLTVMPPAEVQAEARRVPRHVEQALGRFGVEVEASQWETEPQGRMPWSYRATFRLDDGPFSLLVDFECQSAFLITSTKLGTTVAPALKPLLVLPRTNFIQRLFRFGDRFGPEVPTDQAFDAAFAVRTHDARTILTPRVRAKLLALTRWDVPTLTVADGVATLEYDYDPDVATIRAAIEALRLVRGASPLVRFLR